MTDEIKVAMQWAVSYALSNIEEVLAEDEGMTERAKAEFVRGLEDAEEFLADSTTESDYEDYIGDAW